MVDLGLAQKTRSALILIAAYSDEDRALITVMSHTRQNSADRNFELPVSVPFLKPGAFVVQSVSTIPAKLALRRLGTISDEQLRMIEDGVRSWLAL